MTSTASLASKNQKLIAPKLLGDFPAIRNLSSLNDLNSLNDLSGLNVEWIIKNPQFYGFLALLFLEAVCHKSNFRIS